MEIYQQISRCVKVATLIQESEFSKDVHCSLSQTWYTSFLLAVHSKEPLYLSPSSASTGDIARFQWKKDWTLVIKFIFLL